MISIKKLNKIYKQNKNNAFHALKDIDLEIGENELVILQGVSGSGKSTLLSIIASFAKPTNGAVTVMGEHTAKLPDKYISDFRKEHIGFVFQSFNLFENLSVRENILSSLVGLGLDNKKVDDLIDNSLKTANIYHKKEQKVSSLSGGEKQRCAIARAIVNDPDIILFDEPTANLDKENSRNFLKIIRELKSMGKTIIISTHDPLFKELDMVTKNITMENGEIIDK